MWIQVIDNFVNLIGGEAEGLPLPAEYLEANPNVLNLAAENYEPLPELNDYYDAEADCFVPYQEWMEKQPRPEPQPSAPTLEEIQSQLLRMENNQLDIIGGEIGLYEQGMATQEMIQPIQGAD